MSAAALAGVAPHQRFTRRTTECPICGGHADMPRHHGVRCPGYMGSDGRYAHCARPEHAGLLEMDGAGTFPHYLAGSCRCGRDHGGVPILRPEPRTLPISDDRDALAQRLWEDARPAAGTVVATYLAGRGLVLPIPPSLRYAAELKHGPSERRFPVMLAAVTRWPGEQPVAVHRTFLRRDGTGKADVEPAKMALGPIRGGAVRLSPIGETLAVAEGIETALSLQVATGIPAWAAISASNLPNVVLPPLPLASTVVIGADNDADGLRFAHLAADRWRGDGRRVRLAIPPAGADFNDLLVRGAAA